MAFRRPNISTVVLLLLPLVVLWPAVFAGKGLAPWDHIAPMMSDASQSSSRSWDILQTDGALQFDVWRNMVFSAWRSGEMPVWNPYQLAGTPLLANSQSAPFYPLHILFGLSGLPTPLAMALLAWIHLAIAGIGLAFLARQLGASDEGATLGGALFLLSPFMIAWVPLPSVITTCAWIPLGLGFLLRLYAQFSVKDAGLFSLVTGMMLLGGHLQFAFYGILAIIFLIIWLSISQFRESRNPLRITIIAVACLGVSATISSVQILPTLKYSEFSHRKTGATAEGYKAYVSGSVKPYELVGVVAPGLLGKPGGREADSPEGFNIPTYWPMMVKPGGNYAESALYLCPPVLLGLFMLRRKLDWKHSGGIVGVGLVGLLLALGTALNSLFYNSVPGFASTGSPGRASILVVIAACTLAAWALPRQEEFNPKAKAFPVIALFLIGVVALLAANSFGTLETWIPGQTVTTAVARRVVETVPMLLLSLLLCATGWFVWQKKGLAWLGAGCLLVAHLVISQPFILPMGRPMPTSAASSDPNLRRAYVNLNWDFFRPTSALMPPNTSSLLRVQDVAGYDSLIHRDTVAFLKDLNDGQDPAPAVNGNIMFVKPNLDWSKLDEAGISEVWSRQKLEQAPYEPETADRYLIYRASGSVATLNGNPVSISNLGYSGFKVAASESGTLVVRFRNLPGWIAMAHDRPLKVSGSRWIETEVSPGETVIEFTYRPPGLRLGLVLSLVGTVIAFCLLIISRWLPVSSELDPPPTDGVQ
ncbi:hypothetical protein QPK87_18050 [Kamptonema cortianum]|nr:hypothetical protein [Geitlerinema splendidum]MDK3158459.1 hypothetical protein [Kamptonema cortianum]